LRNSAIWEWWYEWVLLNHFFKCEMILNWETEHLFIIEMSSFFFNTSELNFYSKNISRKIKFNLFILLNYWNLTEFKWLRINQTLLNAKNEILTLLIFSYSHYNNVTKRKCLLIFFLRKKSLHNSFLLIYVRFIKQMPVMSGKPDKNLNISFVDILKVQREKGMDWDFNKYCDFF
jgi:hypothetical protein